MTGRPGWGLACALAWACDAPCEPERHPAVIVHVAAVDCAAVAVLLGQPERPTLRCETLQRRAGCEAWCGRAGLSGPARVRVQTRDGDPLADLAVALSDDRCPEGPDLEVAVEGASALAHLTKSSSGTPLRP